MAEKFSKLLKDKCKEARKKQAALAEEKQKNTTEKDEAQAQQNRDKLIQDLKMSLSIFADSGLTICNLSFTHAEAKIIMDWAAQEDINCRKGLMFTDDVCLIFEW